MSTRIDLGPLTADGQTEWHQLADGEGLIAIEGDFSGGTARVEFATAAGGTPLGQNTEMEATSKTPLRRLRASEHLWARLTLTGAGANASVSAVIII